MRTGHLLRGNSVVIATNAEFFASVLREKLRDAGLQVFVAGNDNDLLTRVKAVNPRFIFIEHCFLGHGTDALIQRMVKYDHIIKIAVWAVSEVRPAAAARYISAGAESFFSLRDTDENIENIINRIAGGRRYCPADVESAFEKDNGNISTDEGLTKREIQIMKLTVERKSNPEIAKVLKVSVHTVKFHRANIYRKCGGNTPLDILRNGLVRGIINVEDL